MNTHDSIPSEYHGWWRIIETSQWSGKFLDSLGPVADVNYEHDGEV